MHIEKVNIENFKCFEGKFPLRLNAGTNILVGNNEAGKSTILEAIHLALSGILSGRYLRNELSQYLFNKAVEDKYIKSLETDSPQTPPYISIELFLSGEDCPALAQLEGNGNSERISSCGIAFRIEFDDQYQSEYEELVKTDGLKTIPIEYYKVSWQSFARDTITSRSIPIKSALIDSARARVSNGSDVYISRIIRENLEDRERVEISQAHREMKEAFMDAKPVQVINDKIKENANITDKDIKISVDLSTQNAWETSLMTYLDEIPFHYVGRGEQSVVKTNLAMSHKKSQEASIILLEEPENHLSHSKLNELLEEISANLGDKQLIVSTHSSFVANKLGLNQLIFLNNFKSAQLNDLKPDTRDFFIKLAGYDTLRLILCKKAILVEGDSDELILQKAYMAHNEDRLPIEDGIDVISVGTSFLRFLEIAEEINKDVVVVTDNDGDVNAVEKKYRKYLGKNGKKNIKICFDKKVREPKNGSFPPGFNYNTLEPNLLRKNSKEKLNKIFGKSYDTDESLLKFMRANKTECALKIFNTEQTVKFPKYILKAIGTK